MRVRVCECRGGACVFVKKRERWWKHGVWRDEDGELDVDSEKRVANLAVFLFYIYIETN